MPRAVFSFFVVLVSQAAFSDSIRLISSGYGDQLFAFDLEDGSLTGVEANPQQVDPAMSWVQFDRGSGNLYAAHEVDSYDNGEVSLDGTGAVSRWALMDDGLTFERREVRSSLGLNPAHFAVSVQDRIAIVTNYNGGSMAAYALEGDDLSLSEDPIYSETYGEGSGVVPDRQESSHPHGTWFYGEEGNRFAFVADLGADTLYFYQLRDDTLLRVPLDIDVGPGTGPRHAVVDENSGLVYLLCELQTLIKVYSINYDSGEFTLETTYEYELPGDTDFTQDQRGGEIALDPAGAFLYISHRGVNEFLLTFSVQPPEEGFLLQEDREPLEGLEHRYITVTEDGRSLLTVAQNSDLVQVYSIDNQGRLEFADDAPSGNAPAIVQIIG